MCFEIRRSVREDLRDAVKLDKTAFGPDAWSFLDFVDTFTDSTVRRFTAVADGRFAGFAASYLDETDYVYLLTLAVCPEFRGRGIGAALLKCCEEAFEADGARLNVDDQNLPAIRLYERAGYHTVGRIRNYYMNGHDALIMEKTKE